MDLSGVIRSLPHVSISVSRPATGSWAKGLHVAGTPAAASGNGNVWPASGRELLKLPEAMRDRETLGFNADFEMLLKDRFSYDGDTYEVQRLSNYGDIAGFWGGLATKVGN